jgi:RNA polymerase sigma-70 factor (ECF subfamily)
VVNELTLELAPSNVRAYDDRGWLAAAQRGEPWALERMYEENHAAVYALCHRLLGRSDDAEDATQSTFVQAFRALPRFRGAASPKTWLYRIAVNEATNLLRKRAKAPAPLEGDAPVGDGAPRVTEHVMVRGAMARLKPDHRVVLALRFWEELSYEEIAAVLGLPLPTVKMRLKRAKEAFRKAYEGAM